MKYPHYIAGKDFNLLDADEIRAIRSIKKIAQHGIMYPGGNVVVLTSNVAEDLDLIFNRNSGWSHSKRPNHVRTGWKVIVIPNGALCGVTKDSDLYGVSFTALSAPIEQPPEMRWTKN